MAAKIGTLFKGKLIQRRDLLLVMHTEKVARLKRYWSVLRLADGRLVIGPSVAHASNGPDSVKLDFAGHQLAGGVVVREMWVMTPRPAPRSVFRWVPPTDQKDGWWEPKLQLRKD